MGNRELESSATSRLERFLERDVLARADFSAAVAWIACGGETVATAASGARDAEGREPVAVDDVFDLASLTKPWVATLALELDRLRELPLEAAVGSVLEGVPAWLAERSLEDLLRHRSGLPAWAPLYALGQPPERALRYALERFAAEPGPQGVYSDLGYIVWAAAAEAALGRPLAATLRRTLRPLGIGGLGADGVTLERGEPLRAAVSFMDTAKERDLAAALGLRIAALAAPPPGVPQDGNARFLGGVCGHAGLFGTAGAMLRLAEEWRSPRVLDAESVHRALGSSGVHGLGWRLESLTAEAFSPDAFGHTGFVGGSVWIDPQRELCAVLVGHRRDPFLDLSPMRTQFHRLAAELVSDEGVRAQ